MPLMTLQFCKPAPSMVAKLTVALLVVYLRNLIASGVLPLDRVWLDVQEVCVRYIWLPQVREFRAWLEGSVVGGGGGGGAEG